ncbi:S4 domain-containing protein [Aneurinibacillus aneurinilyticus]|nr:S4 domain-containing protein [Aneurinibacillus aneurinilyticus]MED0705880.1 S4 domain-containing protein [Aneurinibacillus aneurinilyticus]MED0722731.1 S4 domain-containing protein [Aneurinibacillus aneurinilyticus]MED0731435.1 S4 domain-containing protein [Aneurinibacillus aneurinilyticus]MED0740191.1 S4 domain-containing protein [Aneurinibacillus aneurinilyticus]
MNILAVLTHSRICATNGEARRMVHQGAVRINEQLIKDVDHKLKDGVYTITLGRRMTRRVHILDGKMVYPRKDERDESEFRKTEQMMHHPTWKRVGGVMKQTRR